MGSDERRPSLEAPSLGLRRRRKARPVSAGEQPTAPVAHADEDAPAPGAEGGHPVDPGTPPTVQASATVTEVTEPVPPTVTGAAAEDAATEPDEEPRRQPLNGHLAAALAGLVVGAFLVLATFGGFQGCESVRGTTSCGGGPGFLLLLLIVALAVALGAGVLRALGTPSAGSISFLAVALVAVLTLLFLLDSLEDITGGVVVGALTVGAYLLSHWVTVRYLDTVE
jgi:hypothetical protein